MKECEQIKSGHTFGFFAVKYFLALLVMHTFASKMFK